MKRNIFFIFLFFVLLQSSCSEEEVIGGKTGYFQFYVEKDTSTILKPTTRAEELPIAMQIIDKDGNVVKETDNWQNWATKPIELESGTYTVRAFSKDVNADVVRFDEPYYVGQTNITVTPKVNQSVSIVCTLADVKVSVNYSSDVKTYFSKLNCTVKSIAGSLSFDKNETRSGYFTTADLNVSLALTNTDGRSFVLESKPITNVSPREHYRINYRMKSNGSIGDISIKLDPSTNSWNVNIAIPKEATPIVNTWANFADLSLSLGKDVSTIFAKYRESGENDWVTATEPVTLTDDKASIRLNSLTPNTAYDFCFELNGQDGKVVTAQTEPIVPLHNGSFDNWAKKDKTWFPGTQEEADKKNSYWDSGNVGGTSTIFTNVNPTVGDADICPVAKDGQSAKLVSQNIAVKFAAGNIYIGRYMTTYTDLSNMGARIRFGREFSSRPTELKGWYKYTRGKDKMYGDYNKSELTDSGGDKCSIYIVLTDNIGLVDADGVKTAYEIDNHATDQPAKFIYKNAIDFSENNKDVIAYGSITDEESKGSFDESGNVVWKQFSIDLKYRDLTRKPKFIIVVASASKYGDFFTGYENSTMLIDDFELVYGTPVTAN
ncbi:DUF4493 domain-containing protein [Bacteroides fragilis]|uniref:DUF4493 domain-containing protein n=1 Tax=Bacteroides TaxID=816 RepID=UPI001C7D2480|nr:DUF4493 domain-containing protein [Bacteroides fragilis]MCM0383549.1 DUF4493 domain-containing protein [Bacteroides fragilis]